MNLETELARLKNLFDKGLIDEAEYREEKKALLSSSRGGSNSQSGPTSGAPRPGATALDFAPTMMLDAGDRVYRLEEKLGEGGMGQVWRALDEAESEIVGKPVWKAVKILPLSADADPVAYKRLKEEAILAARLSHPNIVSVFDWREMRGQNIPFIVMEWLQGQDLGHMLAAEGDPGLPLERVLELLAPVVDALDYAWKECQIVHRDIKPGNIFLTHDGKIKLLDFGIAARSGKTGSMLGYEGKERARSPEYGAPEVAAKQKPNPSMDVYGLGILTYALLEGDTPFGDNRTPHTPMPDKPEALNDAQWRVLQRAFAFEASQRYQTAFDFLRDLEQSDGEILNLLGKVAQLATDATRQKRELDELKAIDEQELDFKEKLNKISELISQQRKDRTLD